MIAIGKSHEGPAQGARAGDLRGIMAILPLAPRGVRQRQRVGSIADNCPSDLPPALPRAFLAPKGSVQSLGRLVEWVIGGGGSAGAAIGNAAIASTTANCRAEPMAALLIVPRRVPRPRSHRRRTRIQEFPDDQSCQTARGHRPRSPARDPSHTMHNAEEAIYCVTRRTPGAPRRITIPRRGLDHCPV